MSTIKRVSHVNILRYKPRHSPVRILAAILPPASRNCDPPLGFSWGMGVFHLPHLKLEEGNTILRELVHQCGASTTIKPARERFGYAADEIWNMTSEEIVAMNKRRAAGEFDPA